MNARRFQVTAEIDKAYKNIISQATTRDRDKKFNLQELELSSIAKHEQINVLQPLIYNDPKLKETMDINHRFSRLTGGWISPQFKVVYRALPKTDDPALETVFDVPKGVIDHFSGAKKSLPNHEDRMEFVAQIAKKFNGLMLNKKTYMEDELRKIHAWQNA